MNGLISISLIKILQTKTYTVIVLGNDEKKFPIYMEPLVGQIAQEFFSNEKLPRPQTFDFFDRSFMGLDVKIRRVLLYDIDETIFFAKILIEQQQEKITHLVEIDSRPSDALILALRHNVPIFCEPHVFEEAIAYVELEQDLSSSS